MTWLVLSSNSRHLVNFSEPLYRTLAAASRKKLTGFATTVNGTTEEPENEHE